tara:strand:+ start:137 stop:649 length:513 start_codon:yes stop_codon:yes gene_type:complete
MYSPYSPLTSRKQLDNEFSKLRKLTYNAFRWWRMYDNPNKPLCNKSPFRDRILNGDFDYSHYKYQADWCEHEMNDIAEECGEDIGKYVEKTSLLRSRRKRLLEDFEKDENGKLEMLIKTFTVNFKCNEEQVYEEIDKCSGSLMDLYYIMEDKYPKYNIIRSKRGRPKKVI